MKRTLFLGALIALLLSGTASAATATGTLEVIGAIQSSITIGVAPSGGTITGSGTAASTSTYGNISKWSASTPFGVSRTRGASDWTLTQMLAITVQKANLSSGNYTLTAKLNTSPALGIAFKMNGTTINSNDATTITTSGTYGTATNVLWDLVIADSTIAPTIDNIISFTAVSN